MIHASREHKSTLRSEASMVVVMICQKAEAKSSRMQVELYWHSINKSVSPLTNLRVGAVLLREQIQKSHRIGADCLCWCVPHAIVVAERVGKHCLQIGMFGGGDFNCKKLRGHHHIKLFREREKSPLPVCRPQILVESTF